MTPFRWEMNVQTGERKPVDLTDAELALAAVNKAEEDARNVTLAAAQARAAARQARLDAFLDKIEADPTILDRIR